MLVSVGSKVLLTKDQGPSHFNPVHLLPVFAWITRADHWWCWAVRVESGWWERLKDYLRLLVFCIKWDKITKPEDLEFEEIRAEIPLRHKLFFLIVYLFLAVLGLRCCKQRLLSSRGVHVSLCHGFSCCRARPLGHTGSVVSAPRL